MKNEKFLFLIVFAFAFGGWLGFYYQSQDFSLVRIKDVGIETSKRESKSYFGHQSTNAELVTTAVQADGGQCEPQKHLMFMKTHKTASTATQNAIFRFAEKYNLQIGFSNQMDIRFHYAAMFKSSFVLKTPRPIDIICHHMRFDYGEVRKVLPPDAVFFTIMREPTSLFESTFDYMYSECAPFRRIKKSPNALEMWLNHTDIYFKGKGDGSFWWFAKNGMFFDLGYDNLNESEAYINFAIQNLEKQFKLVMISDYYEESMILLKDLLCWDFEDILYLKTNARNSVSTSMNERLRKKILAWNKADAMLYNHFNRTFWKKVEEYGIDRMQRDIAHLNALNQKLKEDCVEGDAVPNTMIKDRRNKVYNPRAVVMTGYNLKQSAQNNMTCVNLLKAEVPFTFELKRRVQSAKFVPRSRPAAALAVVKPNPAVAKPVVAVNGVKPPGSAAELVNPQPPNEINPQPASDKANVIINPQSSIATADQSKKFNSLNNNR